LFAESGTGGIPALCLASTLDDPWEHGITL